MAGCLFVQQLAEIPTLNRLLKNQEKDVDMRYVVRIVV